VSRSLIRILDFVLHNSRKPTRIAKLIIVKVVGKAQVKLSVNKFKGKTLTKLANYKILGFTF